MNSAAPTGVGWNEGFGVTHDDATTEQEMTMTKSVRIENADTSSYKVRVTAQEKNAEGVWVDVFNEKPTELNFPTAIVTVGIHVNKRYMVEEFT